MSCCMLSKPPTEKHVITKSAPASARLRSSSASYGQRDAAPARDLAAELLHELQALGVEIVQHDVARRRATACWRSRTAAAAPSGSCRRRRPRCFGPMSSSLRVARRRQARSATSTSISTAPPRGQRGDADRRAGVAARRRRTRRRAAGSRRRRPPAAARSRARDATKPSTVSTRSMRSSDRARRAAPTARSARTSARPRRPRSTREVARRARPGARARRRGRAGAGPTCAPGRRARRSRRADRAAGTDRATSSPSSASRVVDRAHSHLSRKAGSSVPCHR